MKSDSINFLTSKLSPLSVFQRGSFFYSPSLPPSFSRYVSPLSTVARDVHYIEFVGKTLRLGLPCANKWENDLRCRAEEVELRRSMQDLTISSAFKATVERFQDEIGDCISLTSDILHFGTAVCKKRHRRSLEINR